VRNVFAHTLHPCDFDNLEVVEDCAKLKLNPYAKDFGALMSIDGSTAKGRFTFVTLLIYTTLTQKLEPLVKAKLLMEKEPWRAWTLPSWLETLIRPSLDTDHPETDSKEP
jgi:hypothetical protein